MGEVLNNFWKTIRKRVYKKGDKSEYGNYRGISLVSVDRKLFSMMILFRLRYAVKFWEKKSAVLGKVEKVLPEFSLLS